MIGKERLKQCHTQERPVQRALGTTLPPPLFRKLVKKNLHTVCHHFVGAQFFFSHRGPHPRSAATAYYVPLFIYNGSRVLKKCTKKCWCLYWIIGSSFGAIRAHVRVNWSVSNRGHVYASNTLLLNFKTPAVYTSVLVYTALDITCLHYRENTSRIV